MSALDSKILPERRAANNNWAPRDPALQDAVALLVEGIRDAADFAEELITSVGEHYSYAGEAAIGRLEEAATKFRQTLAGKPEPLTVVRPI